MVKAIVKEAFRQDIGRGIVRLGSKIMKELNLSTGDAILIKGKKKAAALVWGVLPKNESDVIRMDGMLRYNAGTSLDEEVELEAIELKTAKKVLLAPTQEISFSNDFVEYVHERILNMPLVVGNSILINVLGTQLQLIVTKMDTEYGRITWDTDLKISEKPMKVKMPGKGVRYENIGGLEKEIEAIRELVEIPMKNPELFRKLGISPPKGVLLYGPPGTGKTLLARAVANETDAHFISLNGPEIMSKYYGQSEENLRKVFKEAQENAPAIIFFDEIDAIASSREEVSGEVEKRVVSQLLTLMDGLEARGDVIVIAATNRPDALDPALRRPGRFDREIQIGMPNRKARKEILQIHTRNMPLAKDVSIEEIADLANGFSGADLEALAKEAAMRALRRVMPKIKKSNGKITKAILDEIIIMREDFLDALKYVEPSAMRDVSVDVPKVSWDDIGGLDDVKKEIKETVEWPIKYRHLYESAGIKAPRGIILYGPPGTGKTLIAKAVANEANLNFIAVKGPELLSKWVGESEKGIRKIFSRARHVAPSLIFFDEIDALVPARGSSISDVSDKLTAQLLTEMDGITEIKDIVIMASTNRLDLIDPALLRPGRFDKAIYVGLPDAKSREQIFKVHTRNMKLAKTVDFKKLADLTEGYSGADIRAVCVEAGMIAVREAVENNKKEIKAVSMKDFKKAIEKIKPSVKKSDEKDSKIVR